MLSVLTEVNIFEFENPDTMDDKQCKEIKRFAAMTMGSDFFLLDHKSKHRYKVTINNIEGYDPNQIKNEELSGNISKFPSVTSDDDQSIQ